MEEGPAHSRPLQAQCVCLRSPLELCEKTEVEKISCFCSSEPVTPSVLPLMIKYADVPQMKYESTLMQYDQHQITFFQFMQFENFTQVFEPQIRADNVAEWIF